MEPTLLSTETKPSSETKPEDKTLLEAKPDDKTKTEAKPEGAPEKYEFKAPEGYELNGEVMKEASALFKEANLSQSQAQKLVDLYSAQMQKVAQGTVKSVQDQNAGWVNQIKTNPKYANEFDSQGKIRPDSKVLVGFNRMLDSLGNAKLANDFRAALGFTGAGNHPAVFEMMDVLAQRFGEGTSVRGNGASPHGQTPAGTAQRKSAAQEMYPTLPSANG